MDLHAQNLNSVSPEPPAAPSSKKLKFGCSGCLMVILGLILLAYFVVFQTSIPLKLVAGSIEKNTIIDGRQLEIRGVGGSLSRGLKIKELVVPGEYGDTTIKNLKVKYKKPVRWFTRGQVTITEISTSSAEFVVANDFFEADEETDEESPEEGLEEADSDTSQEDSSTAGEGFFDLQLLKFENTRIRTVDGSVDVNIPLIHLKGLYIDHDEFKIEEFEIDSNVLSAALAEGRSVEIDGDKFVFDQRIEFVVKPDIHEKVIRDIPVTFEFNKDSGQTTTRITAFDGALEQVDFGARTSFIHLKSFSPENYLLLDEFVMPSQFEMTSRQTEDLVKVEAGSFVLGKTTFQFEAQDIDETDDQAAIEAKASAGPYQVTALVRPDKSEKAWPPILVQLNSTPEAPMREILAQLRHDSDYASLSAEDKLSIDKIK